MNPRAVTFRALHRIPEGWGTAVTVQAMVFGNMGEGSATGVAFTRDPATGEDSLYGEYLPNAQGEDVVAGLRTPHPLTKEQADNSNLVAMEDAMPVTFQELRDVAKRLENHFREMQDIEFTVEAGKLWMLQTRDGKRTARAAIRIAVAMAEKGLIAKTEALRRIDPASLEQLLHPAISPDVERTVIGRGLPHRRAPRRAKSSSPPRKQFRRRARGAGRSSCVRKRVRRISTACMPRRVF
jgi:pyruvate,orthophosphate dikinase